MSYLLLLAPFETVTMDSLFEVVYFIIGRCSRVSTETGIIEMGIYGFRDLRFH